MRNFTQTEAACCDGFAVDSNDEDSHKHSIFHRRRHDITRKGCPISKFCKFISWSIKLTILSFNAVLSDSVSECLFDLDLESFVTELINDASDVIPLLDSSDDEACFTIFALNSSEVDSSVNALGHIVNGTVMRKFLKHGDVFRSLRENVFLHVVRGVDSKVIIMAKSSSVAMLGKRWLAL